MNVEETLRQYRLGSLSHGDFVLPKGGSLLDVIKKTDVPSCAGAYVISALGPESEILYVGRSGTIRCDGSLGEQSLRERLSNKQGGMSRAQFFERQMELRSLEGLRFEWFETFRDGRGTPPFLVEAELLAAYLADFGRLPPLNKSA